MSDEKQEPIKPSQLAAIRKGVKEILASSKDTVRTSLVQTLSQKEIERRTAATTSVWEKIEEADKELKKIKPTYTGFTLDNKPVGDPIYTKEQVDSHKKLTEQREKLNKALELALNEGDFSKVLELGGK